MLKEIPNDRPMTKRDRIEIRVTNEEQNLREKMASIVKTLRSEATAIEELAAHVEENPFYVAERLVSKLGYLTNSCGLESIMYSVSQIALNRGKLAELPENE